MSNSWIGDVNSDEPEEEQDPDPKTNGSETKTEAIVQEATEQEGDEEQEKEDETSETEETVETVEEPEVEEPETSDSSETNLSDSEANESLGEVSVSSVSEMDDDSSEETESDESTDTVVEDSLIPEGAMSIDEMNERERQWKMLVWGPPGLFKSHFAYSMPEPIAYIDLEGKAQDISHKFGDKEIYFWQPDDFRGAQEALAEGLDFLEAYKKEHGDTGTVVIDSMSLAWEWAKTAYKKESYPMKSEEDLKEVTLSSNMGSSQESDWQHIKGMHNSEFRHWMTDSEFHFLWTAGETEDYASVMSGDSDSNGTPMTDDGEKNNAHKADSIIRARYGDDGTKVGDLVKSNFTDNKFRGLERPTFDKVTDTIEDIEEAESSASNKQSKLESEHGVEITKGKP